MTENFGVLGGTAHLSGVERVVNAPLPTVYGDFHAVGYLDHDRGEEQVALVYGEIGDIGASAVCVAPGRRGCSPGSIRNA
ncbi:hypothetical protein SAVCW2_64210 [Streptomyces avermitilis]|nr:hypothetical protein SAVCW2_64210 [Streptomyces avermitilis]